MALITISPIPALVRWERGASRPSVVQFTGGRMAVTGLRAIRDERRAYQSGRGPRLSMVVEANEGEALLVFDARRRRWFIEAIDVAA